MPDRDAYIAKLKAQLDEWNAEIDQLEAKTRGMKADAQIAAQQQIETAKAKRDEAAAKLQELETAGEGAWEDIKSGAELAWTSLRDAVSSARSRFQ